MKMSKIKYTLFIFLLCVEYVYSQNVEFIYTKDSYNFESDLIFFKEDIPFEEQCIKQIKKNSKCYSNLTDYSLSYNGYSVLFVTNEDGTSGYALLDDLKRTDSDLLPKTLTNCFYISSWTNEIIFSNSIDKLFFYEPYWKKEWRTSIGEKWYDCLFPSYFEFMQNEMYVYSYNQTRRYFLIKKIEVNKEYIKIYATNKRYTDYYTTSEEGNFIKAIEPFADYVFYIKQDGDYLKVYLNDINNELIELTKGNLTINEYHTYLKSIALEQDTKNSTITWPRHADGTCDYEEVSSIKTVSTPSNNVAKNKTMTVSENLKLRSAEATTSEVITVMSAGTKVKILELGKAENIDGINSNWVKVEVQSGAKDRDGRTIRAGTVGWCYGGYLK